MESFMRSSNDISDMAEKEYALEFHGSSYMINLFASDSLLTLEIELVDTCDRWSGEFTSQYIEEISHKAGNFKKFAVFVKMLSSAFSRESESVYVDLLTYNDLEMLKARKMGSGSSISSSSLSRSQMKRYIILTYSGEFDRVHFPLPLVYEEVPNVKSLQRTIKRLRQQAQQREILLSAPSSMRERDIRQIDSQLRQENTELKHRLRQAESRVGHIGDSSSSLVAKLKRQVESLKKELSDSSAAYERLRADVARERTKWRQSGSSAGTRGPRGSTDHAKVLKLQSVLEQERAEHRRDRQRLMRELDDAKRLLSRRNSSSSASATQSRHSSFSASRGRSKSPFGERKTVKSSTARRLPSDRNDGSSRRGRGEDSYSNLSRTASASRSRSPSSSLGGRFDPTAYALERAERLKKSKKSSPWGSRSADRYAHESGYSSANSQSTNDSRHSRRSTHSVSSRASSKGSAGSDRSKTKGKAPSSRVKRKPKARKPKTDTVSSYSTPMMQNGVDLIQRHGSNIESARGSTLKSWQGESQHVKASLSEYLEYGGDISELDQMRVLDPGFDPSSSKDSGAHLIIPQHSHPVDEIESRDTEDGDSSTDDGRVVDQTESYSTNKITANNPLKDKPYQQNGFDCDTSFDRSTSQLFREKEKIMNRPSQDSESEKKIPQDNVVANDTSGDTNDTSDIDRRISALQKFLDKARSGIMTDRDSNKT